MPRILETSDIRKRDPGGEIPVSVIMAAHNGARYIAKALDPALSRDVPLEILVIDTTSVVYVFLVKATCHSYDIKRRT